MHEEAAQATIQARLFLEQAAKRRKKKKKRKKRVPRTSSHSSRGLARRRQRQWHLSSLPCDVSPRAVFPSVYDRPKMLDIMAGMEQKNSYVLLFFAPCTVFPSLSSGPRCSASWPVWTRRISSGLSPYSALCLVRQRIHAVRQFTEYFIFYVYLWIMGPQVDSRPALFQRLLGSTVNTSLCVSLRGWSSWSQCTSRCVSFVVLRPEMLDIVAGLDQKDNFLRGLVAIPTNNTPPQQHTTTTHHTKQPHTTTHTTTHTPQHTTTHHNTPQHTTTTTTTTTHHNHNHYHYHYHNHHNHHTSAILSRVNTCPGGRPVVCGPSGWPRC